jgi:hypothetical protein
VLPLASRQISKRRASQEDEEEKGEQQVGTFDEIASRFLSTPFQDLTVAVDIINYS